MAKNPHFLGKRLIAKTRLARWEAEIARAVQRALDHQRAHVLATLPRVHGAVTASIPPDAFDLNTWGDDLGKYVESSTQGIYDDIRKTTAGRFLIQPGTLPEIDLTGRLDRLLGKMSGLGPETSASIGDTLTQGVFAGESIPKLAARVQSVFDSSDRRAELIARTEVGGASNGIAHDYASAISGVGDMPVLQKTWLATDDERTRPSHVDADGQTVGIDDPFEVGADELMYPGDEDGSPEEVANCRCTPIFDEEGTEYGDDLHIDVGGEGG